MPKPKSKNDGKPTPKKKLESPFGKAELNEFRKLLILRRCVLQGDVDMLQSEALKKGSDAGDLSSLPLHIADQGTDNFEQEITLGLMENESDELQEIEEALQRIKEGRFGMCENCEKPIPKTRLKAIPYARFCVPCKRKTDGD